MPTPPPTEGGAPAPGGRFGTRRWLAVIGAIALIAGFTAARSLLVPIVFSVLVSFVLAPGVRALAQARIPRLVASLVLVLSTLAVGVGLFAALAEPVQEWMKRAPVAVDRLEQKVNEWRRPLRAATEATEDLIGLADGDTPSTTAPTVVAAEKPNVVMSVLKEAPAVVTSVIASVFLIFLLLLHGEELLRKSIVLVPRLSAKKELVQGTREIQVELSRYLITVTLINIGLGLATALALWGLGVEDPLLWAGVVAVMNYAPYVGPAITAGVLLIVGFAEHSDPLLAMAVPGAFLMLHAIEGQFITPTLVGRRLALDPVVIFVALMLFGWMWGIAGLLLAVPMLACMRITASHVPGGETWVVLLSDETARARLRAPSEDSAPAQQQPAGGGGQA